ncbi:hypothetical protein [Microbacterium gorillae]|uniref:hypothetical protein n=1 Tax=Microbacterium gorillae TaxID=1231063 RepID=UPI003D9873C7
MSAFRGRALLSATVLVTMLLTGGCSATIAPDPNAGTANSASSPSIPAAGTDSGSATTDAPQPSTGAQNTASGTGSVTAQEHRAALAKTVDQQLTCGGGNLEITEFSVRVEVTDDCDTIVVTGSSVMVLAQNVKTLVVDAFSTDALVASADAIRVTSNGSSTTVRWESGAPSIEDAGFASDLRLSEFAE